jgi:hypothetical protein
VTGDLIQSILEKIPPVTGDLIQSFLEKIPPVTGDLIQSFLEKIPPLPLYKLGNWKWQSTHCV